MNQASSDLIVDIQNAYKPKRWNGFISDIKEESSAFKQILKDAKTSRDKSKEDYEKAVMRSYKVIHCSPKEEKKLNNNSVPRLSKLSKRKSQTQNKNRSINLSSSNPPDLPFEYDARVTNHYKWPNRPTSAYRILRPVRLNDYPDVKRKKDIACVMGSPIRAKTSQSPKY